MRVVIDQLTRMAAGYICVGGLDDSGRHIRPVLDRSRIPSSMLATSGGPFSIGALVDLGPTTPVGRAPEVEDHLFEIPNVRRVDQVEPGGLWDLLHADAELRLTDIFGRDLMRVGKGAAIPVGCGKASLGTLRPGYLPRLEVERGRVRCRLADSYLDELSLSVTDVRFYREGTDGWALRGDVVDRVSEALKKKTAAILSVGVGRAWARNPDDEERHWLQVNNIHLEPEARHAYGGFGVVGMDALKREGPPPAEVPQREERADTPTRRKQQQSDIHDESFQQAPSERNAGRRIPAPREFMYPSALPSDTPGSERVVWEALGELPEQWRVFHGVQWQSLRRGAPGDGEADFVLLHPEHGLLVIEAKGGGVHVEDGVWYTDNQEGSFEIDPFEQALSSKKALLRYLHDSVADLPWLPAGHAVWFPEVTVLGDLGPAAPDGIVLDRFDLADAAAAASRLCDHWELAGRIPEHYIERITGLLAPTFQIRRTLSDDMADVGGQISELTETQKRAFAGLRRVRRLVVYGGAGTGKTILAVERARMLAGEGHRVLLTCFNRPLGDTLAAMFDGYENVHAGSFHRLVYWWARQAGLPTPENPPLEWWGDPAAELVMEAASRAEQRYDAVIVDEGQDFGPSWFLALESLMADPEAGQFLVFADTHQILYQENWEPPFDAVSYELDQNVRNTRPIAEVVARVIGDPPPREGAGGPPVSFVPLDEDGRLAKAVGSTLHRQTHEEGLEARRIVVLSALRDDKDSLVGTKLAGLPLAGLGAGAPGVVCETIHRFKGLESDAAVVVLRRLDTARDRTLAYVGLSRAKLHLTVVAPREVLAELRSQTS